MNCLNCDTVILKVGALIENGTALLATNESKKIESDGLKRFVHCQKCKAKNILGDVPNDKITWIQEKFVSFEFD